MGWSANLSDGTVVNESDKHAGQKSPWQTLLGYCRKNNIKITGLRLAIRDFSVTALPQKLCDGYIQLRKYAEYVYQKKKMNWQGIGSVIEDKVYITWIDIDAAQHGRYQTYQEVIPLSEVKVHTTLS